MKKLDSELIENIAYLKNNFLKEISKVIIGQQNIIENLFISLLTDGHSIIIGVPGLAKTLLVQSIASLLDLDFKRIQFTPDLMPADITGTDILQEDPISKKRYFKFSKGPLFANIILADEINRTPPKTQAALLQAMQEKEITSSGETYKLPSPFFVLATQNPIEQEGTYPLPEAELDRFMFSINIGYPSLFEEVDIVLKTTSNYDNSLSSLISKEEIDRYQKLVRDIPVSRNLCEFAVKIVNLTRPYKNSLQWVNNYILWGAGPRASQNLILSAKAKAASEGRYTPCRSDILFFLKPVLHHRIILSFAAEADSITIDNIFSMINKEIKKL